MRRTNLLFGEALRELLYDDEHYIAWTSGRLNLAAIARELHRSSEAALRAAYAGKRPPTRELMEDCARIARIDAGYFVEYRDPRDETAAA